MELQALSRLNQGEGRQSQREDSWLCVSEVGGEEEGVANGIICMQIEKSYNMAVF